VAAYGSALQALGDPTRLAVFEQIARRPRAVGEIAQELPVTRPAVSQHLKVLKEAGLVTDRAEGARRIYHVNPSGVEAIRHWLDGFWDEALAAFKQVAEAGEETK
jgi:DNA-binding transcriptional ArsR family regulator